MLENKDRLLAQLAKKLALNPFIFWSNYLW